MDDLTTEQILQIDRQHIWHPYSSLTNPLPAYVVDHADGVRLYLADGRDLIDGMASWWAMIHGYNHPALNSALKMQIESLSHVMFGGLVHRPAAQLVKTLVSLSPPELEKVFLCDSGSVSVEVAIKMALQYWQSKGIGKSRLLALRGGYHGDTFAAMSVCDPVTGMHHLFSNAMKQQLFAEKPGCRFDELWNPQALENIRNLLQKHHKDLAAVIVEPIVQGAGGMYFYHPQYLRELRTLCNEFDVLLIADEIATGFGRTGKLFACEWAQISPDIMCIGKALTGGYLSLAATLCSEKISNGISEGEAGVFMHGPTFMGNPLACSAANASIKLLLDSNWKTRIAEIETQLHAGLKPAEELAQVADVRVLGAIGVIEMKQPVNVGEIQKLFVERGVWVRPFGKMVYVMPPYIIDDHDLATLTKGMVEVVASYKP